MTMPVLLIVRPENRLAADADAAVAAGWQAAAYPLLQIEADAAALAALPAQLTTAAAVFWVSPTAVETAAAVITTWPDCPHVAVGSATAEALRQAGATRIHVSSHGNDSEAALALPLWSSLPRAAHIVLARGHEGRNWLAEQLADQGFQVASANLYHRRAAHPPWPLPANALPDAVWITSSELVRRLFACAPPNLAQPLQSLLYFTHHPRIADTLRQQGAYRIRLLDSTAELATALAAAATTRKEPHEPA